MTINLSAIVESSTHLLPIRVGLYLSLLFIDVSHNFSLGEDILRAYNSSSYTCFYI